jgi:hypothetical protein
MAHSARGYENVTHDKVADPSDAGMDHLPPIQNGW